jgi:hypothetical protein
MICFHKWNYGKKYVVKMEFHQLITGKIIPYLEHRQDKTCLKCGKVKTVIVDPKE